MRRVITCDGRPVSGDRRAMHDPPIPAFIPRPSAVQRTAVVPHHQIAGLPAMRVDENSGWSVLNVSVMFVVKLDPAESVLASREGASRKAAPEERAGGVLPVR